MYAHVCNTTLMAWETRRRGSVYYTRSVRVNGVVRRHYLGKDNLAYLIASLDEDERTLRDCESEAWHLERKAALRQEAPLIEFDQGLDALLAATFTAAGYHRPNYGPWRKKRGTSTENSPAPSGAPSGSNLDQRIANA
jgi:hypothetical protein